MADITISDLELAPALADDMVLAVENTTDTYAATLAMLRRLLNKTFVEAEDADFNDLTDDGFYQCTGTPTNSPEAGAINWTLQVSAESGVVVQRAFSLDENFANLYIRRWNGVTWTAWIEEGGGALTHKADIDLNNVNNTGNVAASNLNSKGIRTVVETYKSGTNWYRIYSDGWIEQGGFAERNQVNIAQGVTFLKKFVDNSYVSLAIVDTFDGEGYNYFASTAQDDATGARLTIYTRGHGGTVGTRICHWYACGY